MFSQLCSHRTDYTVMDSLYSYVLTGLTMAYSAVITHGDARGERIRTSDVICTHITDILIDSTLCRFLGKDYLNILAKHILVSSHHCANVTQAKWMGECFGYY